MQIKNWTIIEMFYYNLCSTRHSLAMNRLEFVVESTSFFIWVNDYSTSFSTILISMMLRVAITMKTFDFKLFLYCLGEIRTDLSCHLCQMLLSGVVFKRYNTIFVTEIAEFTRLPTTRAEKKSASQIHVARCRAETDCLIRTVVSNMIVCWANTQRVRFFSSKIDFVVPNFSIHSTQFCSNTYQVSVWARRISDLA